MTADDVHAKLVAAIQGAEQAAQSPQGAERDVLVTITQPLALASIALELRALREHLEHPRVRVPGEPDLTGWRET